MQQLSKQEESDALGNSTFFYFKFYIGGDGIVYFFFLPNTLKSLCRLYDVAFAVYGIRNAYPFRVLSFWSFLVGHQNVGPQPLFSCVFVILAIQTKNLLSRFLNRKSMVPYSNNSLRIQAKFGDKILSCIQIKNAFFIRG